MPYANGWYEMGRFCLQEMRQFAIIIAKTGMDTAPENDDDRYVWNGNLPETDYPLYEPGDEWQRVGDGAYQKRVPASE